MKRDKFLLWLSIYWILYGAIILKYFWSNQLVVLLPDILVFYLSIFGRKPKQISLKSMIGVFLPNLLALFLLLGIVSSLVNLTPLTSTLWGVRMFLRFSLILNLVYCYFDIKDVLKFKRTLYFSIPINFLFCILQYGSGQTGDYMGGIFAANGDLAIYLLVCLMFVSIDYFLHKLKFWCVILFVVTAFVEAMWAEIKLLYFLIPLVLYLMFVLLKRFSLVHIVVLISSLFLLLPLLKYSLSFYYGEQYINDTFDVEAVKTYTTENNYGYTDDSFNRSTSIELTHVYYLHDFFNLLLGYGIGSGTYSSYFKTWIGESATKTLYFYFTPSYVLIETGWVGFLIFILGHLLFLFFFLRKYIRAKNKLTKQWTALGFVLMLITFVFIWYNALPYSSWYLPYIVWGVCLVELRNRNKQLVK